MSHFVQAFHIFDLDTILGMKRTPLLLAMMLFAGFSASAAIKLPKLLASHMVLQRQQPIHLWGWADPGEKVTAEMSGKSQSAVADNMGHWSIYLPALEAGGPYSLSLTGSNEIDLDDILIGDVWFASGQSNMEMPLKGFGNGTVIQHADEEIRNANHPDIRLFHAPNRSSDFPLPDYDAEWTACTPETATNFSAVAYFFGRDISNDQHVPIGLIDSSWGGTPAEAWVSMEGLSSDAALMPVFSEWAQMADLTAEKPALLRAEKLEDQQALAAGKPKPVHPWHPAPESWQPAGLFNGMVAAALNYGIKGVIWYQGESNSGLARANMYEKIFPALINDWRTHWGEGNFPFLFVQLAAFRSSPVESYATIREAQRRTLGLTDTGMAVTIDIGTENNVHPPDKQDVGARLALAAEALAYGKQIEYAGPTFRETSVDGSNLRIWFTHTTGGLKTSSGPLTGFEVAGADHHFVPATAQINGDTVVLTAEGVTSPKYARYGWANFPIVNLVNGEGLPASPFTSEPYIPNVDLPQ
jgi:sialate O-acetylesterase